MRLIKIPILHYFNQCFKNVFDANYLLSTLIYLTMSIIMAMSFFPSLLFMKTIFNNFINNNQDKINHKFRQIKSCNHCDTSLSTSTKSSKHKLSPCKTSSKSCNLSNKKKYKKSISFSNSTICSIKSKKNKFNRKNKYHSKYILKNKNGIINKKNSSYINSTEVSKVLKNFKLD